MFNEKFTSIEEGVLEGVISGKLGKSEIRTDSGLHIYIRNPERIRQIFTLSEKPLLILASGPSESGKSTWGRLLLREGIATRYKILKCVSDLLNSNGDDLKKIFNTTDPVKFLGCVGGLGGNDAKYVNGLIVTQIIDDLKKWDTPIATIESMSHAWLTRLMTENNRIRALSVFINPSIADRIAREAQKENITLEEAKQLVQKKDRLKSTQGVWAVKGSCDILVENSGDLKHHEDFIKSLGKMALKKTSKFSGKPLEYK